MDITSPNDDWEICELCGRTAEDVEYDFIGPDPNEMDLEKWGYLCGPDKGCQGFEPEL